MAPGCPCSQLWAALGWMFGASHTPGWWWGSVPGTQPGGVTLQLLPLLCPPRSTKTAPRFWSRSIAATPSCATPVAPCTLPCCPSPMAAWTKAVRGRWGAQSWALHSKLAAVMAGLDAVWGRGLAGPGCEESAQVLERTTELLTLIPIPQPLAPAATPRCVTRL